MADIRGGEYLECSDVLIQIIDYNSPLFGEIDFPKPAYGFKEIYKFRFNDTNDEDDLYCITELQALKLVKILQDALDKNQNVIVHCHAGLCRSGAVAEVGIMMGFWDTYRIRLPNSLVKRRMMKVLGWTYDAEDEKQCLTVSECAT